MPCRRQFRTHAEYCLRLAELINSPEQKASLNASANAWHRFAQELDLRGTPIRIEPRALRPKWDAVISRTHGRDERPMD
jgi:hypothetical protein